MMFAGKGGGSTIQVGSLIFSKGILNTSVITAMTAHYMNTGEHSCCGGGNKVFFWALHFSLGGGPKIEREWVGTRC